MFFPEKKDGYSRMGKIKIDKEVLKTPTLVEFNGNCEFLKYVDFGKAPYALKFIYPTIYEQLKASESEVEVLTALNLLSPHQLVEAFNEKRSAKPLYVVASATPMNAALLIYLGADVLDNILAIVKAYNGTYFLGDLEVNVSSLSKFPCSCKYCEDKQPSDLNGRELFEVIAGHNTEVLRSEVEKCRYLLENEGLRNYVEAKVKLHPEMTAAFRILDITGDKRSFPRFRKSKCYFSTIESINRFEVSYFLNRALECYESVTDTVLLLPCTAKKPYLTSRTHRFIRSRVKVNVNEIVISSPLVVPREYELVYPAVNYDTPVTGHWSEEEINFVAHWLQRFIEKGEFDRVVAHVDGGYKKVVERAMKSTNIEVVYTAEKGILNGGSLKKLQEEIRGEDRFDLYHQVFSHMLRYQFSIEIEFKKCRYSGRYPEIEMAERRERVARVDVKYGMLDIYEKIAHLLIDKNKYVVEIDDFDFTNTIFAAGVLEADSNIRPNDVVVFRGSEIMGIGMAVMDGRDMVESEKGTAIRVKRKYPL